MSEGGAGVVSRCLGGDLAQTFVGWELEVSTSVTDARGNLRYRAFLKRGFSIIHDDSVGTTTLSLHLQLYVAKDPLIEQFGGFRS